MTIHKNPISVTYTDAKLRILIEEYITMQRCVFTFCGVCDYVLYRAMEEGRTVGQTLYESNKLQPADQERICCVLKKIVKEGRIKASDDNARFRKTNE